MSSSLPVAEMIARLETKIAFERLWGAQLRHRIDPRSAAATLRRWADIGLLDVVRKGTSHREGLYTKPREP